MSLEHLNSLCESLIVVGSQAGNIHGWDIRRKKPAMGAITHVCVGPSVHSVVVGTARGFIAVFDMRFEFPVQMWRHYDASSIVSLYVTECRALLDKAVLPELCFHNRFVTHPHEERRGNEAVGRAGQRGWQAAAHQLDRGRPSSSSARKSTFCTR